MKQYLDLMKDILENGDVKNPARNNMPRTKELFGEVIKCDLQEGFPLLTTKKMFTKGIIEELLWFLSGSTNIGDLTKKDVHIWDEDGFKFWQKKGGKCTFEQWVNSAKEPGNSSIHDAGRNYSYLWRKWGADNRKIEIDGTDMEKRYENVSEGVDQIVNLINMIIKTPDSRYQIITAWDPSVVVSGDVALPSCHILWQTSIRAGEYLDLNIYQRSCDYVLGVPFNIASYALLIHLLALLTGYKPGVLKWIGGSVHIYENQIDACIEQLKREPKELPKLEINIKKIYQEINLGKREGYTSELLDVIFKKLDYSDFTFENYNPHPAIKAPLSTGLKLEPYKLVW